MNIDIKDILIDKRTDCLSIIGVVTVKDYIDYIEDVFKNKGGIDGQRAPLKTKTAISIRKRMISDIIKGTVLPPMVIGVNTKEEIYEGIKENSEKVKEVVVSENKENISLIDGMQRTTALKEALDTKPDLDTTVRVEFWVSKNMNNLIYRMLVLNTAQIPWSIKRQLEVVFNSVKQQITDRINSIVLFDEDDKSRRVAAAQYQTNHIIELFLCFSLRKVQIDLKESIAEGFARLDIIESTSRDKFLEIFIESLNYMVILDEIFEKAIPTNGGLVLKKFKTGYDIFSSHPARISFITSLAQKIYGKPGFKYEDEKVDSNKLNIFGILDKFIEQIKDKNAQELFEYLALEALDERINIPSGKVGEFERSYFLHVFSEMIDLIDKEDLTSLEPVWVSYH